MNASVEARISARIQSLIVKKMKKLSASRWNNVPEMVSKLYRWINLLPRLLENVMYCSDSFLLLILVLVSRMKNVHIHRRLDDLIQSLRFDRKSWFPRFAVSYKDKRFLAETVITILFSFPLSFKNYSQPELNNGLEQNLISSLCFMSASQNNYSDLPIHNLTPRIRNQCAGFIFYTFHTSLYPFVFHGL